MYWSSLRFRTSRYLKPARVARSRSCAGSNRRSNGGPSPVSFRRHSSTVHHPRGCSKLRTAARNRTGSGLWWATKAKNAPSREAGFQGELEGVTLHDLNVAHSGLSDPAAAGCRHLSIQVQGVQAPANQKFGQGNCEESRTATNVRHRVVHVDGAKAQDYKGIRLFDATR